MQCFYTKSTCWTDVIWLQFSESGAAYHVDVPGGSTQLSLQTAWYVSSVVGMQVTYVMHRWQDCLTNDTFFDAFPRLKMMMHFGRFSYEGIHYTKLKCLLYRIRKG